jgi:hypothetical protein
LEISSVSGVLRRIGPLFGEATRELACLKTKPAF